jgi:hypothetical protein
MRAKIRIFIDLSYLSFTKNGIFQKNYYFILHLL